MLCSQIQKQLPLHAGGDLDPTDAVEVDVHLRRCLSCYREWSELRETLAAVRGIGRDGPALRAPEQFVGSVMDAVRAGPPLQIRSRLRWVSFTGWAAAAALLLWLSLPGRDDAPGPGRSPGPVTGTIVKEAAPAGAEASGLRLVEDAEFLPFLSPESDAGAVEERAGTPRSLRPPKGQNPQFQLTGARDF